VVLFVFLGIVWDLGGRENKGFRTWEEGKERRGNPKPSDFGEIQKTSQ
jgi:hypothetical protein